MGASKKRVSLKDSVTDSLRSMSKKYETKLLESDEWERADSPAVSVVVDDEPPSNLFPWLKPTVSSAQPRDLSKATRVWGEISGKSSSIGIANVYRGKGS
jgi:hypothetical protein